LCDLKAGFLIRSHRLSLSPLAAISASTAQRIGSGSARQATTTRARAGSLGQFWGQ
jgi:hypothetical protein